MHKEFTLEIRNKYALAGILLFGFTTVFVVFKAFTEVNVQTWNVLYWVLLLFVCTNAILKSFVAEKGNQAIYLYTLVNPSALIIAKLIYNFIFLLILASVIYLFFSFLNINPIKDYTLFALDVLLCSYGLAAVFSFSSAISALENNASTLMAILALPLILPIILLAIKISAVALRIIVDTDVSTDLYLLGGINLMLTGILIILFPTLWKS